MKRSAQEIVSELVNALEQAHAHIARGDHLVVAAHETLQYIEDAMATEGLEDLMFGRGDFAPAA